MSDGWSERYAARNLTAAFIAILAREKPLGKKFRVSLYVDNGEVVESKVLSLRRIRGKRKSDGGAVAEHPAASLSFDELKAEFAGLSEDRRNGLLRVIWELLRVIGAEHTREITRHETRQKEHERQNDENRR